MLSARAQLVNEGQGRGRSVARNLDTLEEQRLGYGSEAVAPAVRRLEKVDVRLGELRAELDTLGREREQLDRLIGWATSGPLGQPVGGVQVPRLGDPRSAVARSSPERPGDSYGEK